MKAIMAPITERGNCFTIMKSYMKAIMAPITERGNCFTIMKSYMKAIIGKKIKMTRIFDEKGLVVPVTLVLVEDCTVTQVKTEDKDGYKGTQIGLDMDIKMNKPMTGHLASSKIKSRNLKEFALDEELKIGDKLDLSQFKNNDKVTVAAISKGKGFAGTVKRHHFHLGPKTHGSNNYRQPGSIGSMYPQRVIKGRRMAGHLGYDQVTVKNLTIAQVDMDKKLLFIKGAVPGANKSIVYIWAESDNNQTASTEGLEKQND